MTGVVRERSNSMMIMEPLPSGRFVDTLYSYIQPCITVEPLSWGHLGTMRQPIYTEHQVEAQV